MKQFIFLLMQASTLVLTCLLCFLLGFDGNAILLLALIFPPIFNQFLQLASLGLASYIFYVFSRYLTDGNSLYSAISVRLVGNNSQIHLFRILTSFKLFLNHEFNDRYPVLTEVYNNVSTLLGKALFL